MVVAHAVALVAGIGLLAFTIVDLVWTTLGSGKAAGPLTRVVTRAVWKAGTGLGGRDPKSRIVATTGIASLLLVVAVWLLLAYAGWAVIFASFEESLEATATGEAASLADRLYFVGYAVFTLGNGEFRPASPVWQVATVATTGTGLVLVSLAITYLVPVASAVTSRRHLAGYITSLGESPTELLVSAWDGRSWGRLDDHLIALTPLLHEAAQRHLTYPVLHFFHSTERSSSAPVSVAVLDETLTLLLHAVREDARPTPSAILPVRRAIGSLLDTVRSSFISPATQAPPAPSLDPLRDAGIPVVDDDSFRLALESIAERRRVVRALVEDDCWPADTVWPSKRHAEEKQQAG